MIASLETVDFCKLINKVFDSSVIGLTNGTM